MLCKECTAVCSSIAPDRYRLRTASSCWSVRHTSYADTRAFLHSETHTYVCQIHVHIQYTHQSINQSIHPSIDACIH
jgi:hypothetical protein